MRHALILCLAIVPVAFSVFAEWEAGENLVITSLRLTSGEWEGQESNKFPAAHFRKRGTEYGDSLFIVEDNTFNQNLDSFYQIADPGGPKLCKKFISDILDRTAIDGYPRLMWKTKCIKDGYEGNTLQIAIQGNEKLYHLTKTWRMRISDRELSDWRSRFSKISVCDSRIPTRPCPAGKIFRWRY